MASKTILLALSALVCLVAIASTQSLDDGKQLYYLILEIFQVFWKSKKYNFNAFSKFRRYLTRFINIILNQLQFVNIRMFKFKKSNECNDDRKKGT
jgi:hypothetical protein